MAITVRLDEETKTDWFKRMNRRLVQSYGRKFPMMHIHKKNFEETYGVKVIVENSRWAAIEFDSEFDLMRYM